MSAYDVPVIAIALLALLLDIAFGDPPRLYRMVPHPVAALGRLIAGLDGMLNRPTAPAEQNRLRGGIALLGVVAVAAAAAWIVESLVTTVSWGWVAEAAVASTLIACRALDDHVWAVKQGLETNLEAGREAVSHIVGRDPETLDEPGVVRAAIESLAENLSDGTVAPLFWFLVLGLPGLFVYKAINTLDSMIGYRNERYLNFGATAARIDDFVNWAPARLTGWLIAAAAAVTPGASAEAARRAMKRDARGHRSANAGWPEAAMGGALDLALAGPRHYGGSAVSDPWIGGRRQNVTPGDIGRALTLYRVATALLVAILLALWAL